MFIGLGTFAAVFYENGKIMEWYNDLTTEYISNMFLDPMFKNTTQIKRLRVRRRGGRRIHGEGGGRLLRTSSPCDIKTNYE